MTDKFERGRGRPPKRKDPPIATYLNQTVKMNSSQKGGRIQLGGMCKCGSTTHKHTDHSECRLNEKNRGSGISVPSKKKKKKNRKDGISVDDRASEISDVIYYSEDLKVCPPQLVTVAGALKMT